jgi:hypothetical protein
MIPVGCCNNVTGCSGGRIGASQPRYELTIDPQGAVSPGASIAVALGGKAVFSEGFLDGLQGFVPGGTTQLDLTDLAATVQIRSGGTMPGVTLTNVPLATTCLITSTACDSANDVASVPGSRPNTDCQPTGTFNPCRALVSFPISNDCAAGGLCETLGKAYQCAANGYCVTGGLEIPLETKACTFTADASGDVLFGWAEDVPGQGQNPNGSISLPPPSFADPVAPLGMRLNMSSVHFAVQCTMAEQGGTCVGTGFACDNDEDCSGSGYCVGDYVFIPAPDTDLISIPIVE